MLTLSACNETEFSCNGGDCVSMVKRCDGISNCRDGSDEVDCRMVVRMNGYNKFITPMHGGEQIPLRVNVSINILDIIEINEVKDVFKVKIDFTRGWFDNRLTFKNLKKHSPSLNNLLSDDVKSLWYPSVDINNIEAETHFRKTSVQDTFKVVPNQDFKFTLSDMTYEKNVRLFMGSENGLHVTKQWSVTFICHYNTMMYPFDTQLCRMEFLEGAGYSNMDLRPQQLYYNTAISLNRYVLHHIKMCRSNVVKKQAIVIEVALGRPLLSNVLTVFIPTTILLAISYMSRVFKEEFLDMVIQVNLTVVLVQATL